MRSSLIAVLAATFVLAACGKDSERPPYTDDRTPSGSPSPTPAPPPGETSTAKTQWTGTLEKLGPSIHMQGTHKLSEGGKIVVLLKSTKVDLATFEGKRVSVTGTASPTVEGGQTIVEVDAVREAP